MEFHLFLPQMRLSPGALRGRAEAAEAAGFTGLALMDHLFPPGAPDQPMYEAMTAVTWLAAVTERTAGVRRWGAAALDLAFVAAGRFDAFFEFGLAPWDVAAGLLLVREAGGFVGDISGNPYALGGPSILASNGELGRPLRDLLARAKPAVPPKAVAG